VPIGAASPENDQVLGAIGVAVLILALITFVLPGSFVVNPMLDLRDAGRLWWLPPAIKQMVRERWPEMEPHLRGPRS
jgi:hypothetical protein